MAERSLKDTLKVQQYGLVGNHSSVKLCSWLKKSMHDKGVCYKEKFYGIRSHLCCQMTPSVGYCMNNCVYCWRTVEHELKRFDPVDEPEAIYQGCVASQKKLISGIKGDSRANISKWKQGHLPVHFAISLSGEPTMYPKLSELIKTIHSHGATTFLVTNGQFPDVLKKVEAPTQMYLSLSATDEQSFKEIQQPLLADGWQRLNRSLEVLKERKKDTRTTIRVTAIKGVNMDHPERWAALIKKAEPLFVEVKAYMHVGASQHRLKRENMPLHDEIRAFSEEICKHLGYKIIDEQVPSRVVLLMKEDIPGRIMKF